MIETDIKNAGDISRLFTDINPFSMSNSKPYENKRTMCYRVVGKMRDIFIKGPCRDSDIITMNKSWNNVYPNLENVKIKLRDKNLYGFLTYKKGEGVTIWVLVPNSDLLKEEGDNKESDSNKNSNQTNTELGKLSRFNSLVENDIEMRRWMSAFNNAQKAMTDSSNSSKDNAPFAISFITSITINNIPFFGRVAWGVSVKNDIIALTQIPLMVASNRDQYFTWSFVPKIPIKESELYNKFARGGGENSYTVFNKLREYLLKECEPLNPTGSYSFAKGNSEEEPKQKAKPKDGQERPGDAEYSEDNATDKTENNKKSMSGRDILLQDQKEQNENYLQAVKESLEQAKSFLIDETYKMMNEWDYNREDKDDPDYVGDDRASFPSGQPYLSTLKMNGDIPLLGPLY